MSAQCLAVRGYRVSVKSRERRKEQHPCSPLVVPVMSSVGLDITTELFGFLVWLFGIGHYLFLK